MYKTYQNNCQNTHVGFNSTHPDSNPMTTVVDTTIAGMQTPTMTDLLKQIYSDPISVDLLFANWMQMQDVKATIVSLIMDMWTLLFRTEIGTMVLPEEHCLTTHARNWSKVKFEEMSIVENELLETILTQKDACVCTSNRFIHQPVFLQFKKTPEDHKKQIYDPRRVFVCFLDFLSNLMQDDTNFFMFVDNVARCCSTWTLCKVDTKPEDQPFISALADCTMEIAHDMREQEKLELMRGGHLWEGKMTAFLNTHPSPYRIN